MGELTTEYVDKIIIEARNDCTMHVIWVGDVLLFGFFLLLDRTVWQQEISMDSNPQRHSEHRTLWIWAEGLWPVSKRFFVLETQAKTQISP